MSLARSTLLVIVSRFLVLLAGLVVSVVAAHSLTTIEQGYFFTFLSLAAAQTLFELGITNLILHHLSHARAGILTAITEEQARSAIDLAESTRAYSARYFRTAACLFFVLVGLGGAAFFAWSDRLHDVHWVLPWLLMLAGTALSLYNLNYFSHLEAFGRLGISYRIRIASTVILVISFSLLAFLFGGLLCYPAALLVSNGFAFWALRSARAEISREYRLHEAKSSQRISIAPEQRRMAVSAVAGYVTANSLTPYAFHFFGAEVAGQVGLTMSIFAAMAAVAMARTTAEAPSYGPLIAGGAMDALKSRFRSTQSFSVALALLLGIAAIAMHQVGLLLFPQYANRVLGMAGFVAIGLLLVANVTVSVTSTALRAFRTEMLMGPSLLAALIVLAGQFAFRLDPVQCISLMAAFNGLVFYPYARRLLLAKISLARHD